MLDYQNQICDLMGQNQALVTIFSHGVKYTNFKAIYSASYW